ncbi:MAG: TspO/MBR family protein [Burkholderiaceae bacterium]|nr:tryptophan-rich sensory protein [Burkholderiaceae bacterium]MBU6292981.1 tryptophan-rich sensory protein [Burkholderiales bacterium]
MQADSSSKKPIVIAILLSLIVGGLGGAATEIGPWYFQLQKPSWQPPDWLFGPAWTTIYVLTSIAGVKAWRRADEVQRRYFMGALLLNLVLNLLWSLIFFTSQRPDIALIEVVPLWLSILLMVLLVRSYSPVSALLMLPYLGWVAFAAYLNWTIVTLNAPF